MITFDDARNIVAGSPVVRAMWGDDFTVADYGRENQDAYEIVALAVSGMAPIDAPALIVDKQTGELREVYGLLGEEALPDMTPVPRDL